MTTSALAIYLLRSSGKFQLGRDTIHGEKRFSFGCTVGNKLQNMCCDSKKNSCSWWITLTTLLCFFGCNVYVGSV